MGESAKVRTTLAITPLQTEDNANGKCLRMN